MCRADSITHDISDLSFKASLEAISSLSHAHTHGFSPHPRLPAAGLQSLSSPTSLISSDTLSEFQAIGPSQTPGKMGQQLIRRRRDGSTYTWVAEEEDAMPTLVDLLDRVDPAIGFNVEVKFAADDSKDAGGAAEIDRILSALLPVSSAS
ncbi:unnamed protein product [Closterium sp. Yama58-4]|nr:unnamed protein product [Closterium sp. Yama58-4]